ncbi:MAG: CoA transferase [Alphaproteobacteria bacterium]|nr:CoA transferase [Alphaproteobacteria bacterium]
MTDAAQPLEHILTQAGRSRRADDDLSIDGGDPVLPTNFLIGTAANAALAAVGLAAADLWALRGGGPQRVSIDARTAAAALRSERYMRVDDGEAPDLWSPISGFYETGDSRWVQLHCNFPHHRDGVLALLECPNERDAVAEAIKGWEGEALETALAEAQMCAGMVRSPAEWAAHDQAKAVADLPLFEITRIGDAPPEPLPEGDRPLAGIRALDLTRVLAGPVCGKLLAGFGADVMRIAGPHLPYVEPLVMDTGLGKLSAHLDLREAEDCERLMRLVDGADIFTQAYRPGAIAGYGFSPEQLAARRPGIVCVSLCAYSHAGPWQNRRGFDSLVQTVSGIAYEGGDGTAPKHLPAQALDHVTGFLAAYGAMAALARRAEEGGSWLVRLSLAQTGHWIKSLGRLEGDVDGRALHDPTLDDVRDLTMETETPYGRMRHVVPPIGLSETPMRWDRPSVPLGTHDPVWPA